MRTNSSLARWLLTVLLLAGLFFGAAGKSLAGVDGTSRFAALPGDIVISEFRTRGPVNGGTDEFVEFYNPKPYPVDVSGWKVWGSNNAGNNNSSPRYTFSLNTIIDPGKHYLIVKSGSSGYSGAVDGDGTYGTGISDDGGIAITLPDGTTIIDQVGMSAGSLYKEPDNTGILAPMTVAEGNANKSYERKPGGMGGNCTDTNNNGSDFQMINTSDPQNLSSPAIFCAGVETFTPTNTLPPTDTLTPTSTPTATAPLSLVINEIGWSGTKYSPGDEWIELYNPSLVDIDLNGWRLASDDGNLDISLSGKTIPSGDYFLIGSYSNIFSDAVIDLAFSSSIGRWSSLSNNGTVLRLFDPTGAPVDSANSASPDGEWLAGSKSPNYASMERISPIGADGFVSWATFAGTTFIAHDRATPTPNPIWGTPGQVNWIAGTVVTPSPSNTPTRTSTPTKTATATSTLTPTSVAPRSVIINEVGWMGTAASSSDEWIELYNRTNKPINLNGWSLRALDGSPDIALSGTIPAQGFYLLERVDDDTIKGKAANLIYSGEMSNSGETLRLFDHGNLVDTANENGGPWPAGSSSTYGSMERSSVNVRDLDANWFTHPAGVNPRCGHDANWNGVNANANRINGTPKCANWAINVTATATVTRTSTPTGTAPPSPVPFKTVVISEVAWAGTNSSSYDEWIELYNNTADPVSLNGWHLVSYRWDGTRFVINLNIALQGTILPRTSSNQNDTSGYFLLEARENAISNITADQLYGGSLYNSGEILLLCSAYNIEIAKNCTINTKNQLVDFVNGSLTSDGKAKPWPAGSSSTYGSMERKDVRSDEATAYYTHTGATPRFGLDANGNNIKGTPKHANWAFTVTATPYATVTPTRTPTPIPAAAPILVINEVLARAGTDWNLDGVVDVYDEFIEVINAGTVSVSMSNYKLMDSKNTSFTLPSQTLQPGERALFYAGQSGIRLEDAGDTIRLVRISSNSVVDEISYPVVRSVDASVCRYTDGYGSWIFGCFPTPGRPNSLSGEGSEGGSVSACLMPDSTPLEFVQAECEEFGNGIWNPGYWDSFPGEGSEVWQSDPHDKWIVYYE